MSRAAATIGRHPETWSQWQAPRVLPSFASNDPLDTDDAPGHPGLVPISRLAAPALPVLEPAAPRPPVIARNPPAPRRVKIPAPSADDVPSA